jgi:hypothetical protein
MLDGIWFETWTRPFIQGVLDYSNLVVWHVKSFGGLVENSVHNNMLCGGLPTPGRRLGWYLGRML